MKTQTKRIKGKLLDISNNNLLANVIAEITLHDPQHQGDRYKYEVLLVVDGYKPELANKSHILNLNNKIFGEVFIAISGIPGEQTRYNCNLQDNKWNNPDWFKEF